MWKNIVGDLKTSFAGAALAGWQVFAHGVNWKSLLQAVAIAALGAFTTTKPAK